MNTMLWVVQVLLALFFFVSGVMKLKGTREQLAVAMPWVERVEPRTIHVLGIVEILGAVGLIIPGVAGHVTWLTPVTAIGLALLMVGAIMMQAGRKDYPRLLLPGVVLVLAIFVAYGRGIVAPL